MNPDLHETDDAKKEKNTETSPCKERMVRPKISLCRPMSENEELRELPSRTFVPTFVPIWMQVADNRDQKCKGTAERRFSSRMLQ